MTTEPHPNDMTHWADIGCKRGCEHHATVDQRISIGGPTRYRDLTSIPTRFTQQFDLEIWDTRITPVDGGPYCPARDAVSETILSHGVWEPAETAVLLMCFEQHPGGLFIDFGSQIGWFSTLALLSNMNVLALDADPDCVDLTYRNLVRAAPLLSSFGSHRERLGPDVIPFSYDDERVRLPIVAKIDVEGAEQYAVRKLQPLIDGGFVRYMLIEMSPVFNETYLALAHGLMDQRFVGYEMPAKRTPPHQLNSLTDLKRWELSRYDINEMPTWHQKDVLWVAGGL